MRRVCVFAGSSVGVRPVYRAVADALGMAIARQGLALVYGGGCVGLMGVVADAVLAGGGEVIGVLPAALDTASLAHRGLTALHVVDGMHARKAMMADLADSFLALPGGLGTFDELFEIITWAQLGFHAKPIAVLNVEGYFDPLLALIDHATAAGFVPPRDRNLLSAGTDPEAILASLESESRAARTARDF